MRVAVTGANGFIGFSIVSQFISLGFEILAVIRGRPSTKLIHPSVKIIFVESLENCQDWNFLRDVDVLVHAAGQASNSRLGLFEKSCFNSNVAATKILVENALKYKVKKFLFLSSAKIYGESSAPGKKFRETSVPDPKSIYAKTKLQAENIVKSLNRESVEFVILRLPVVYGEGAKGMIRQLLRAIELGIPVPLGLTSAPRSFISIINLVDIVAMCVRCERAVNKIINVSDLNDISVKDFSAFIAKMKNRDIRLLNISPKLLKSFGSLFFLENIVNSLTEPHCLECSYLAQEIGWKPVFQLEH